MKKILRKFVVIFLVFAIFLAGYSVVHASYSGSYSFHISASVTGSYSHDLSNSKTWTKVSASSYSFWDDSLIDEDFEYSVKLEKRWSVTSYNSGTILSNNNNVTKHFNNQQNISDGTYRVKVTRHTGTIYDYIKGNGTINQ